MALLGIVIGACDGDPDQLALREGDRPTSPSPGTASAGGRGGDDSVLGPTAACAAGAGSYVGLSGEPLDKRRAEDGAGLNRTRLKPYSVLASELKRVLGAVPPSLAGAAATFGEVPARWDEEPKATALAVSALYDVAFEGCLSYVPTRPELAEGPSNANAGAACSALMRAFWSRTPAKSQIDACATFATTTTAKETDRVRRWAYVCASVLSADGFASY